MSTYTIEEILAREEEEKEKAEKRIRAINAKRNVQHPVYPNLRVDMRTIKEVEETRKIDKPLYPLIRLQRSARKRGQKIKVERDSDGAFRIHGRLDGKTSGYSKIVGA